MQIFLQILSVIGIVLLVLIGLILLLAGLILFVPIRYRVKIIKEAELTAQAHATWLLHFLHISYDYPVSGEIVVKILGIPVWKSDFQKEDTETNAVTGEEKSAEHKQKGNQTAEIKTAEHKQKENQTAEIKNTENEQKKNQTAEYKTTEHKNAENKAVEDETIKSNVFQKICCKIRNICDKIKKICRDFAYYKDLLQKKENRMLFARCKARIYKLLKHMKPGKLQAQVRFGTGEPDTTGYLMGVYGMLLPILGKDICVTPDFDERILEGRGYAKGRITLFYLLYQGVRIYFDEGLHKLIENIKREDN